MSVEDKLLNFERLREKNEALEARIAELEPLAVEKAVRDAGYNPVSPEGRTLVRLSKVGDTAATVQALAEEIGFEVR